MIRTVVTAALVTVAGGSALWWETDGGRAFTTESARRLTVSRRPVPLPPVVLEDQDGRAFTLEAYRGRLVLVDFMYTRCPNVCLLLGRTFDRIQRELPGGTLGTDVALLSISFDRQGDPPARLREYGQHWKADGKRWRIARAHSEAEQNALLAAFGIRAIPDWRGGFVHNASVHLLDRDGRLVRILDVDDPDGAVAQVLSWH